VSPQTHVCEHCQIVWDAHEIHQRLRLPLNTYKLLMVLAREAAQTPDLIVKRKSLEELAHEYGPGRLGQKVKTKSIEQYLQLLERHCLIGIMPGEGGLRDYLLMWPFSWQGQGVAQ
jgi:hypothetical protein